MASVMVVVDYGLIKVSKVNIRMHFTINSICESKLWMKENICNGKCDSK